MYKEYWQVGKIMVDNDLEWMYNSIPLYVVSTYAGTIVMETQNEVLAVYVTGIHNEKLGKYD